jgi:hypothetical protein
MILLDRYASLFQYFYFLVLHTFNVGEGGSGGGGEGNEGENQGHTGRHSL